MPTSQNGAGEPTPWKEIEKVERRLGESIGNLDQRVSSLEMSHQLQSFQNSLTKEKLEEMSRGQEELKTVLEAAREADRKAHRESTNEILARLDEVQFKNKAEIYDKIKWIALGVVVSAITGAIIAAIVNAPM